MAKKSAGQAGDCATPGPRQASGPASRRPASAVHQRRTGAQVSNIAPRNIRLRDAPHYLGMDRNRFNAEVRPFVVEITIGIQGRGFDRLDLDAWYDAYKACNGRPPRKGASPWDARKTPVSSSGPTFGMSISTSQGGEFAKALAQLSLQKRKGTSRG